MERARRRGIGPKKEARRGRRESGDECQTRWTECRVDVQGESGYARPVLVRFTELGFNYSLSILQEQILQEPSAGKEVWE